MRTGILTSLSGGRLPRSTAPRQPTRFKRQMKENRKIEELILMFATVATGILKRDPSLAGDV